MSETLQLTRQLISRPSVTPDDQGCQQLLADRLSALGFEIEHLRFGEVDNLWAHIGNSSPLVLFAGHTDVVPPGPIDEWSNDPFTPVLKDGVLYGRGSADMKGSLAAMIVAAERFLQTNPALNRRLGFLITSDEEGDAVDGTRKVVELLRERQEEIIFCVVGEPSCSKELGDTMRIGRRGSLSARLQIKGVEGHVAYPQLADNPIHSALLPLHELASRTWDEGNAAFPATSFQISNFNAGVGANNVIPGNASIDFNFRYSTELTADSIKQQVEDILNIHGIDYTCDWHLSGEPFLTAESELIETVSRAVEKITGMEPLRSTGGGTSDGRFIATLGTQVVEFGPCNVSIHKVDEHVRAEDLDKLTDIYQRIMEELLGSA